MNDDSGHSLNSPSSFSRRIGCPGSANMEKSLPNESSSFADEGTAAHALGEMCLLEGKDADYYEGEEINVEDDPKKPAKMFTVDQDMISAVQEYVDFCRPLMGHHMIEHKFQLPFLGKGEKGTSDFTALHERVLHVVDYKHGKGVTVEHKGNIQGLCYGLGAAQHFDNHEWDILRITIAQPRAYHDEGGVRSWDVPREELLDYIMNFAAAAKATEDPNAPLKVGSWCRFCKAKPTCPQQAKEAAEVMEMDFSEPTSKPVPVNFLSDAQIADIVLNRIKHIEQWCASLKDYAQTRAEEGKPLPGTKLVATREARVWKDRDKAEKFFAKKLGDKAYKIVKEFHSAPQIEKVVGKKEFKDYAATMVEKVSTGATLVPESDPRTSVRQTVEDEFG
jgi:hypothetical protein